MMTYTEAIKSGFGLINRNWQLVAIQAGMMIINCVGFFVIVGIPLGIAFVIFGLDLTGLAEMRDITGLFRDPSALLSKYMGLVLLIITSFLIYIMIAMTVGLFAFGGSVGSIGHSVIDPSRKFSMKLFFAEAKRIFFRLLWFSLFVVLIFILIAFLLGLLGGGVAAIVQAAKTQDSTLALFLGIFFSLILALFAIGIILGTIAVTVYGIAVLFYKGESTFRAFREAAKFLWNRQSAFWLYVLLFFIYIIASFILMIFTYPFNLIPILGKLISFPLQLVSYVIQSYIGLSILATVFIYYYQAEFGKKGTSGEGASGPDESIARNSSGAGDIYGPEVPMHEDTPPPLERTGEA
jgi:hypothetical protein